MLNVRKLNYYKFKLQGYLENIFSNKYIQQKMTGGLLNLTYTGDEDIHLTDNPEISFFKTVYSRHTNFAVESINPTFKGTIDFGKRITLTVPRNGDLISSIVLEVEIENPSGQHCYGLGNALIVQADVQIGGQLIDRYTSQWANVYGELHQTDEKRQHYDQLVGNVSSAEPTRKKLVIPLRFWFNNSPGMALPLIAMSYHEVIISIELATRNMLLVPEDCKIVSFKPWVDYIYMDTDERRRFAQAQHEYLIEQTQYLGAESVIIPDTNIPASFSHLIKFNHPVKQLYFMVEKDGQPCQSISLHEDRLAQITLNLDKVTHYSNSAETFMHYNQYKYCSSASRDNELIPVGQYINKPDPSKLIKKDTFSNETVSGVIEESKLLGLNKKALDAGKYYNQHIYTISHSLNPEEYQPSGTVNYSRIETISLTFDNIKLDAGEYKLHVFGRNYNILRLISGMAGLVYAS